MEFIVPKQLCVLRISLSWQKKSTNTYKPTLKFKPFTCFVLIARVSTNNIVDPFSWNAHLQVTVHKLAQLFLLLNVERNYFGHCRSLLSTLGVGQGEVIPCTNVTSNEALLG